MCEHKYKLIENIEICELCNNINIIEHDIINDDECKHIFIYCPHKVCEICGVSFNQYLIDNNDNFYIKKYKHKYNFNKRLNFLTNNNNITYNIDISKIINELKQIDNISYNKAYKLRNKYNMKDYDVIHILNIYSCYIKKILHISYDQQILIKKIFNQFLRFWFNSDIIKYRKNLLNYDFILSNILKMCNIQHNTKIFKVIKNYDIKQKYINIWLKFIESEYLKIISNNFIVN